MNASMRRLAPAGALLALFTLAGCAGTGARFPGGAYEEGPRRDDKAFGESCPQVAPGTADAAALAESRALDAIRRTPQLSDFAALVKTAKADDMFASMQNVTVFVPTDAAFEALPAERRKELADPKAAGDTIRSLIVAQDLTKEDLGTGQSHPTLQEGVQLHTRAAAGGVTVDGAEVVCGSVTTSDARLHLLGALPGVGGRGPGG
ncbi:fasciclin domain-containing protein [Streptomyces sp. NPDC041068]|uniref:fasciclin domain-containing protein n=1 Tax=Streptomyces sp. NPDC041068 TaxID=3155130 RepID=UPI0033FEACD4